MQDVRTTKASSVLLCLLPPICPWANMPSVSAQKEILLATLALKIFLTQLSSAIGLYTAGLEYVGLSNFWMIAVVAFFHGEGKCPLIKHFLKTGGSLSEREDSAIHDFIYDSIQTCHLPCWELADGFARLIRCDAGWIERPGIQCWVVNVLLLLCQEFAVNTCSWFPLKEKMGLFSLVRGERAILVGEQRDLPQRL